MRGKVAFRRAIDGAGAVLRSFAMFRPRRPGRTVLLSVLSALAAFATLAHAQGGLRLTRPAPWTPDSVVKAVLNGGSAKLVAEVPVDAGIPRMWLTKAERTQWKQTADYDETVRYCRQLE